MEYILETNQIEKRYNRFKAIDNLSIHVPKGAIYGLIGKNGAGKTTLIRLICDLQKPTSGSYTIYGIKNTDKRILEARKKMGAIIETPSIRLEATAEDNLKEQYRIVGLPSFDNLQEILKLVGLIDTGKKKAKHFSLGMKQRLGIAIALVGNPDFLILDEPINGLDPEGIIEIRELILKLNKEKGITVLISSHYLDELSKIATDYGFIEKGHMVQEICKETLEEKCKKRVELEVSNVKECVKYFEEKQLSYEVISDKCINLYDEINITELAVALSKRDCVIDKFQEKEESLESYYINLMGGGNDV